MASLSKDGVGWRIRFVSPATGDRHTVRTGRCAKKNAETARNMVEKLVEAQSLGASIDGQAAEWLKALDDKMRGRLAKVGLIDLPEATLLADFLDKYIEQRRQRGDVTPATIVVWGHTRRNLVEFFGAGKDLRSVTPADADAWAAWLRTGKTETKKPLAENTTRKRCQFGKMFFSVALRRKLIPENPFTGLVGTLVSIPERKHFIPREAVDELLRQARGPEYRLLLVMARYLGLRIPSEVVPLRWGDIDWDAQRIVITSPKTKRHAGGDKRICPIFPEVLPALREAYEAAPERSEWIFPTIRTTKKNLRSWLERAIVRAGLTPWPRLWQNFRATRATELADRFPSHVAAAWLGHSERIADRHYRQLTSLHQEMAISNPTGAMPGGDKEKPSEKLAHNPAQNPHVMPVLDRTGLPRNAKSPGKKGFSMFPSGGQGTRTLNR